MAQYVRENNSQNANSTPPDERFWDKVRWGGNFNFNIGAFTFIEVSPMATYLFNNRFSAGLGLNYMYLERNFIGSNQKFTTNTFGGRTFGRAHVWENFFVQGEVLGLNVPTFRSFDNSLDRKWFVMPGLGAGYTQPLGGRGFAFLTVTYYFNSSDEAFPYLYSPFRPFVVNAGFAF